MDVRKVLLVKTLRELLTITVCLSCLQQQTQATDIQDEVIKMNKNLEGCHVEDFGFVAEFIFWSAASGWQ